MINFAAYTNVETANAFQWADQPPKIAHSRGVGDLDHHLIHGSLGPRKSAPQTASQSVQPFLPRDAMLARYMLSLSVYRLSVCLSVIDSSASSLKQL